MYNIIESDGVKEFHPNVTNLISNLTLFNQTYDEKSLLKIEDFEDDSDYSNLSTLEEILENFDPNTHTPNIRYHCKVSENYIWSSDRTKINSDGKFGYDRPRDQHFENKQALRISQLRGFNPLDTTKSKGFVSGDCGDLAGCIRVKINENGDYEFTLVKTQGNGRTILKKLANKNTKVELPFSIQFHSPDSTEDECEKIEAAQHHTDAGERTSQNEEQKFASGLRMEKPDSVHCFNFLKDLKIDYAGYMNEKDWPTLSAISGLKNGKHGKGGTFNKFGEKETTYGFRAAREVAKDITKENLIPRGAPYTYASMFHSLTGIFTPSGWKKVSSAIFTHDQLYNFIIKFYEHSNSDNMFGANLKLSKLTVTEHIKSLEYIASTIFWPAIVNYYKSINDLEKGFSVDHPCIKNFLDKAGPYLRTDMIKNMTKS